MIRIVSSFMVRVVQRYLPDPLVLAMLLCLIVFVLGSFKIPTADGEFAALKMAQLWGDGFWNLLAFTMQMAMIIVTGHALASSEPIKKLLRQIASLATTQTRAVML
ncbi:MAG: TIGR00366 family protein, partial [Helicobacter sp.]|nr:TIGR00366 family protein [Helicobacter sp.]